MLFKIGLYSYTGLIYYRKVKTKKILHKLYWKLFNSILGHWFDDSQPVRLVSQSDDPDFAPEFVLRNADKFKQMLIKEWQTILVCLLSIQVKLPCMFIHCFVFLKKMSIILLYPFVLLQNKFEDQNSIIFGYIKCVNKIFVAGKDFLGI
jgi:hypothetical protein